MLEFLCRMSIAGEVPKLIAQFEHAGHFVLLQTPLAGRASGNHFASEHWDFLSRLVLDRSINIGEYLIDQQRLVTLGRLVGAEIVETLAAALSWVERACPRSCRAVVVHGDFVPWNMRTDRSSGKTRILPFDWESGRETGIPVWDAVNFIVVTDILVHRRQPKTILRRVKSLFAGLERESYLSVCGFTPNDTKLLLLAYLCEVIILTLEDQLTNTKLHNARCELLKLVLQQNDI